MPCNVPQPRRFSAEAQLRARDYQVPIQNKHAVLLTALTALLPHKRDQVKGISKGATLDCDTATMLDYSTGHLNVYTSYLVLIRIYGY